MSTGGTFKLIVNDGVQDKLLMATDYLRYRIKLITQHNREQAPNSGGRLDLDNSWIPDMNMISKSHVIFVNGTYKPFVAAGFEYNKVQASGNVRFGANVEFTLPVFGDYINDTVVHVQISGLAAVSPLDRVRYVSMLGHKLFKQVSFKINNNALDTYYSDNYNAYFQFHVKPEKRIGWLRNMGQEIPNQAYLTADPTFDLQRELRWFGDGNQTFKQAHGTVDLWVPILFWFKDIHNSLPNVAIPYGQTNVSIELASVSDVVGFADYGGGGAYTNPTIDIMELYMNNIFIDPEVASLLMKKFGFSLIRVHGRHTTPLSVSNKDVLLNQLKWPTETLYVAFRPNTNDALSQYWHSAAALTITDVKVPVAAKNSALTTVGTVIAAPAPTTSTVALVQTGGPALSLIDDAYNTYDFVITGGTGFSSSDVSTNRYTILDYVGATLVITITGTWNGQTPDTTTTYELFTPQVAINVARYYKESPVIDMLSVVAYGITIFRATTESFYNSYLPYRFGTHMNTPEDRGWYMINFNFYPGEHQPSGYINLSRAREFYLKYTSSYISQTNKVNLVVLSDAINFLLVKDGSAVLRYST
jgi:hypothetical protein